MVKPARVAGNRICGADAGCTCCIAARVRIVLGASAGRVRVELGAGRARVEKFFVRETEC